MKIPVDTFWIGAMVIALFSFISYYLKKIDFLGAIVGWFIACSIYTGGGFSVLSLLFVFFFLGSLASSWKINKKKELGVAEKNNGKRGAINAISNGGTAAFCGLLGHFWPASHELFMVMLASSLASATSDTLSSELGNLYGSKYFNIINFKEGKRGDDGNVSLEGTLFGLIGSAIIAVCYALTSQFDWNIVLIAIAGLMGNFFDSILGATIQKKGWLSNHGVNLLNTVFAVLVAFLLYMFT